MNAAIAHTEKQENRYYSVIAVSTILVTLFLFFIDEGYYDFRWMKQAGNWFVFGIYIAIIGSIQLLMGWLLFRKMKGIEKVLYTVLIGLPAAVVLAFSFFYGLQYLVMM